MRNQYTHEEICNEVSEYRKTFMKFHFEGQGQISQWFPLYLFEKRYDFMFPTATNVNVSIFSRIARYL